MKFKTSALFAFLSFALLAVGQAAAPVINSPTTANASVGSQFTYEITTALDDALAYSNGPLPAGLSMAAGGSTIQGIPEAAGVYSIRLTASNFDGFDEINLQLTVENSLPFITSATIAEGRVGNSFSYSILATGDPTSFLQVGLNAIGGLTLDASTGLISGIPLNAGSYSVIVAAANASGTGATKTLTFNINPEITGILPQPVDVTIITPTAGSTISGSNTQFTISAEVTPQVGAEIDIVYALWTNPGPNSNDPLVVLVSLQEVSRTTASPLVITYEGVVDIGFNPNNRELGGGLNNLSVVAYQKNATIEADMQFDSVSFTVTPLLEWIYPFENFAMDSIEVGDVFCTVRHSSNNFASVSAKISGPNVFETVTDNNDIDNSNGIFNFASTKRIEAPGTYTIRVTAIDNAGNSKVLERQLTISDTLAEPIAEVSSPVPGFRNEVFAPAVLSIGPAGEVLIVSPGQGYYPRNSALEGEVGYTGDEQSRPLDVTDEGLKGFFVPITTEDGTEHVVLVATRNGRVVSTGKFYEIGPWIDINPYGSSRVLYDPGTTYALELRDLVVYVDSMTDPGIASRIPITAEFFQGNAPLAAWELLLDGEVIKSGTYGVDAPPIYTYPQPGGGSPAMGDHVITARVTDTDGEVGTSLPLRFTIVPYDPISINLIRTGTGDIDQGDSVTFEVELDPISDVTEVQFYDTDTNSYLGLGTRVTTSGRSFYRFIRAFNQQGSYGTYARAISFDDRTVESADIRLSVLALNDAQVSISSPSADQTITVGDALNFSAQASSSAGIVSVNWLVNNLLVETDNLASADYTFGTSMDPQTGDPAAGLPFIFGVGIYSVTATALDAIGNTVGAPETIVVTVTESDVSAAITSPTTATSVVSGGTVDFTAVGTASSGISKIEWYVDGVLAASKNASISNYTFGGDIATFPVGQYRITARAYDAFGNTDESVATVVTVTESDVSVAITSPTTATSVVPGENVVFTAEATASVGVAGIEWYVNGVLVASEIAAISDYTFGDIVNYPLGQYRITARAYDFYGNSDESFATVVTMTESDVSVAITSPTTATSVVSGGTIDFTAAGTASSGISKIEWYVDGVLAASKNASISNYTFVASIANYPLGQYRITARAYDAFGNTDESVATVVTVTESDVSVAITSPTTAPTVVLGQNVVLTAEGTASSGISTIEWYVNGVLVASENKAMSNYTFVANIVGGNEGEESSGNATFPPGYYRITARAIDFYGNSDESVATVVTVTESDISVAITSPATSISVESAKAVDFTAVASASVGVANVEWLVNGVVVETDSTAPYKLSHTFSAEGVNSVVARATDTYGNSATSTALEVTLSPPNALLRDEDFVLDIFEKIFGLTPSETQLSEAVAVLDGTLESRSQYVVSLLQSELFTEVETANIIYRTMTGEWPGPEELVQAIDDLRFGASPGSAFEAEGTVFLGQLTVIEYTSTAVNSNITITVEPNPANGIGLFDPTLSVVGPNKEFLGYSDSSFDSNGFSLNAEVSFVSTSAGTYSLTVGGWLGLYAGEFILRVQESGGSSTASANASALAFALVPEYEARFGALNGTTASVNQLFVNKHGAAPNSTNQVRLYNAATGSGETLSNSVVVPGYNSNMASYAGAFAVDNDLSGLQGIGGPLTAVHYYSQPNNPLEIIPLVLLINTLWGLNPNNSQSTIETLSNLSLVDAVGVILSDPQYYGQFTTTTQEGFVAQTMAGLGVYDFNLNAPDEDADGDGQTNLEEIALGSDPTDSSDMVLPMTSAIDGTDFVATFIKLNAATSGGFINFTIQCSPTMLPGSWNNALPSAVQNLAADQSGVPEGYERIEFRMDTTTQNCSFVRVLIN